MNIWPAAKSPSVARVLILIGFLLSDSEVHGGQVVFWQQGPPRDRLPPQRIGTSTLKGRVTDGVTGSPIERARVRIGAGGPRPSVMTDASGAFVIAGLPAGAYTLSVDKASYQSTSYPDRGRGMRSISKPLILQDGRRWTASAFLSTAGALSPDTSSMRTVTPWNGYRFTHSGSQQARGPGPDRWLASPRARMISESFDWRGWNRARTCSWRCRSGSLLPKNPELMENRCLSLRPRTIPTSSRWIRHRRSRCSEVRRSRASISPWPRR